MSELATWSAGQAHVPVSGVQLAAPVTQEYTAVHPTPIFATATIYLQQSLPCFNELMITIIIILLKINNDDDDMRITTMMIMMMMMMMIITIIIIIMIIIIIEK